MSNPLAIFRKNRNYWMAGLVLLAILAFVVAPAIQTLSDFRSDVSASDSAVVVRWSNEKITVGDLRHNLIQHGRLVRFLSALARKVLDAGGQPGVPGAGYSFDPQAGQYFNLGINMATSEQNICQTRILASHAKRMGVELNDQAADDFMQLFCDNKVSAEEYEKIRIDSTDGQLSDFEIRELLKTEIAARISGQLADAGLTAQTPSQTWRDFLKLNQTAKVAAFPVFVDDYLKEVNEEPTETEIQAIYDEGSMRAPNPNSPDPGFGRRYQANFEFVQSDFQAWVEREKATLTEEEIRKEYDRRVELKLLEVPFTPETPPTPESGAPNAEPGATEPGATEPGATEPGATEPGATEPGATEPGATEPAETEPAETEPAATEPAATEPAATEPAATEPAADVPATTPDTPAVEDQGSVAGVRAKFVAFSQDEQTPPPVEQPPQLGETPATDNVPATIDAAPAASDSEEPLAQAVPTMRTKTFEEARDDIASELARTKMIPKLDEVLTKVKADMMTPYFGAFREFRAFRDSGVDDGQTELPPRPDLKKFAAENNLTYGETGLVDAVQLARTPFGQSDIPDTGTGLRGMLANEAMGPYVELFKPLESSHMDRVAMQSGTMVFLQYIAWKTAERGAYVPELAEVRDDVIDAWKRLKARDLADAAARELSKKVGSTSTDPWSNALSTAEQALIIETDPFPWMSRLGQRADISVVDKLPNVGAEFMEQVFATEVGRTGVAPDASKSTFYVFRVVEKGPTDEDLQQRFNADPLKSGPMNIGRFAGQVMLSNWYENLEKELGVEWQMSLNQF
jgi:hypothetical protein